MKSLILQLKTQLIFLLNFKSDDISVIHLDVEYLTMFSL